MTQQQALLPANIPPHDQYLPAAGEGLGPTDLQRIPQSLDSSISDNTRKSYRSAWKTFEQWAQARAALTMPASPALVAAYLSHLAENRLLSFATFRLHRAAIAAILKSNGHQDPTDNEGVRRVMKGIARAHGRAAKQAKPRSGGRKSHSADQAPLGDGKKQESAERAPFRARMDLALLSVLRDGLLRRTEGAALTWGDVELRDDGTSPTNVRRSKTDPEADGITLYIGSQAAKALGAIRPAEEVMNRNTPVFGLSPRQIGRRVSAAARAAGLGEGFTGHSGRVGMAQDLAKTDVELPELMTAGRWKSSTMPARYTERQAADRGAVARYYQEHRD